MFCNQYGNRMFVSETRTEFTLQISNEKEKKWAPLEFKYKPGKDVKRIPPFCLFHLPRLDHSFYFLQFQKPPSWIHSFLLKLLRSSSTVLSLLPSSNSKLFNSNCKPKLKMSKTLLALSPYLSFDDESGQSWWKIEGEETLFEIDDENKMQVDW